MADMTSFRRRCLVSEGFGRLDDVELGRLNLPLRFTPALCLLATAAATLIRSPALFAALAAAAATGAATRRHPFDHVWEHVVRPAVDGPHLPKAPCPRRFAFVMATPVLAGAAVSLASGAEALGLGLGALQMAGCATYVAIGWCGASVVHRKLVRRSPRPQPSAA
jgi:hypothetical protein